MKNILTMLLIVFVMFVQNSAGKSQDEKQLSENDHNIDSVLISTDFQYKLFLTELESCKKDTMIIFETTQGGILAGYFEVNKLRLMRNEYYGEMGKGVIDIFFVDGKVIFVKEIVVNYNVPIYMENSRAVKISEYRYYLKNNRLLKCFDDKGEAVVEDYSTARLGLFNKLIDKYSKNLKPG